MHQEISFREKQKQFIRVRNAYSEKEEAIKFHFKKSEIPYRNYQVFLRAIKDERKLEIWVKSQHREEFQHLISYSFCKTSGTLGPKRKEGDLQIPEGLYHIDHFNPESKFHLSLGINYPNASDKILGDHGNPGGEIYIHGNCVTSGCIPITDDKIKELYIISVEAKNSGQQNIPVHIFPTRLTEDGLEKLKAEYTDAPSLVTFWENLATLYQDFETSRKVKTANVDREGKYYYQCFEKLPESSELSGRGETH